MNKKLFWLVLYLFCAILSCWLTVSSFHLMMPSIPIWVVWGLVVMAYVAASLAFKWMVEGYFNAHVIAYPGLRLWGGLFLFLFAWGIISLPTNAHTFFYKLKIGDVVTEDLKTTKVYSQQIADRVVVDSTYHAKYETVMSYWNEFVGQVTKGKSSNNQFGAIGFGEYADEYITKINAELGKDGEKYKLSYPRPTNRASLNDIVDLLNSYERSELRPKLEALKSDRYQVSSQSAGEARKDVENIVAMEDSVHKLILTSQISEDFAEPLIKECDGVLSVSYSNIKTNSSFVKFNNKDDKERYTADNVETRIARFLSPYSVAYDYFTGRIPFTFTIWLLLSILIDISGFIFFSKL